MPLESGITFPRASDRAELWPQFIQDALAYCENAPLIVLRPDFAAIEIALARIPEAERGALLAILDSRRIGQRKSVFESLARIENISEIMEEVERHLYTSQFSYLGPLYRLLRDYHYYAWYEALLLYTTIKGMGEGEASTVDLDIFQKHRVVYRITRLEDKRIIVSGPMALESGEPSEGQFYRDVRQTLSSFNDDISLLWAQRKRQKIGITGYDLRGNGPIYTADYLSQHAFLRQKTTLDDLLYGHEKVVQLFTAITRSEFIRRQARGMTIHMFSRLAAAASAIYDLAKAGSATRSVTFPVKAVSINSSAVVWLRIDCDGAVAEGHESESNDALTTYHVERSLDRTYTNWQAYNYESFDLLRNWLNNKFGYISQFASSPTNNKEYEKFGRRIGRFLARLFRADECTIYRLDYRSLDGVLLRQGAFINRADEERRSQLMIGHMQTIAKSPRDRAKSICYRAIDSIQSRYCRFAVDLQKEGAEVDSYLAHPTVEDITEWGVSATAVPIPVQGVPWGVIELISDHPHHFSNAARAKLENIASILSPFFYFQSVFDALERAGNAAGDTQASLETRRQGLLAELPDIFLCKSVAVLTKETVMSSRPAQGKQSAILEIRLFGFHGEWWFSNAIVPKRELMPFAALALDSVYYWACQVGGREFSSVFPAARKEFVERHNEDTLLVIRLSPPPEQRLRRFNDEFLLALVLRKEIIIDLKLVELFAFFGRFLLPMFESFYSQESWERVLRNRLGHELTKILKNMDSTQRKFEFLPKRGLAFSDLPAKGLYDELVDDLKKDSKSVKLYSEILSKSRDSISFRDDPEVYIAQQRMAIEGPTVFSLRKVYSGAFMARSAEFKVRNIFVDEFPEENDIRVKSYEWLLRDVMQTLADNISKYAISGRSLEISVQSASYGRILLTISNLAPALTDEDNYRLFTEGGRGTFARAKSGSGKGIGLFLARRLMSAAGYDIRHKQRPPKHSFSEDGYPVMWHDFILEFPGEIRVPQQARVP